MRLILADLPPDARFLGVGAGTGTELIALAQNFPGWHFTAVEPAPVMLNICRHKVEQSGLASRFNFYEGFLDSLPASEPFGGATCLLVSHFFAQSQERSQFFAQIASRLQPQGILRMASYKKVKATEISFTMGSYSWHPEPRPCPFGNSYRTTRIERLVLERARIDWHPRCSCCVRVPL